MGLTLTAKPAAVRRAVKTTFERNSEFARRKGNNFQVAI